MTAEQERDAIVAWMSRTHVPPATIHSFRNRVFLAWQAFRNPNLIFVCARNGAARAIERGEHLRENG